ncbi:hypothetical protein AYO41_01125 [Verrucomicrobia bacterium SCGC AG-212-E04]|nr:hypothetical protein AYO41_01125 [Verrucomicrobia bacterium SCGC AG-212-E04]
MDETAFDSFGLANDRRFMIVDAARNFQTQRSDAHIALIEARFEDGSLVLQVAGAREFRLPLDAPSEGERPITVWRDTVPAADMGNGVAAWLSAVLGRPSRLVRADANFARRLPAARIPAGSTEVFSEVPVAFVDAFPILVISEASLADLNSRLEASLPMNRFRPNIVLRGAEPHEEDRWKIVRVGEMEFRAGGDCGRCIVTTTDQSTGERGPEPLQTLGKYRRDDRGAITFGQYWLHRGAGTIRVGDAVEIVA